MEEGGVVGTFLGGVEVGTFGVGTEKGSGLRD